MEKDKATDNVAKRNSAIGTKNSTQVKEMTSLEGTCNLTKKHLLLYNPLT
ncbi:hypothetical protein C5S31_05835 [ANME-1 cluster archaeon GoMg2]|nr:hypothetical protein [ANME-1 cluster archaeon GoMg2]